MPRSRLRLAAAIGVLALALVLLGLSIDLAFGSHDASPRASANPQVAAQQVLLETPLTPERAAKQHAVPVVDGRRLVVASVGLDVPLGAISVADGQLTPPGIFSAYWVRNLGVTLDRGRQGAVYVVIHSVHADAGAPGNRLIDIAGARSALALGAEIDVAGHRYRVVNTAVISRAELPYRADVWEAPAGTLVLITCLQRSGSPFAVSNVVVQARLI